jgi:nucleoside-diphosphate-sugar epimerase
VVLITGGTGFLGAYIIKELINEGYSVRAIKRSNKLPFFIPREILDKVEWVDGDVLDVVALDDAMKNVDAVIHSAAVVSFNKHNRSEMYKVNVEGTANVVNLALDNNVRKLVHISSIAALGRTSSGDHVDEDKKWVESSLNTHYAISKKKAELEVWRGVGEGLDAVVANPSTILGYGDWNSGSSSIFKRIYKQFTWYTTGVNGFVDVEDVARAVVMLMKSDCSGERFIVNGENWEFQRLFQTIAKCFNRKAPSREAGAFLSGLAWRMEKARSYFSEHKPLLTRETTKIALSRTYFQNAKILRTFPGFSFTPLEETILKTCKKYEEGINSLLLKA